MIQKVIHIHEACNSLLKNHKVIHEKESFSNIKKMLHMLSECILVEDCIISHKRNYSTQDNIYYQMI
jgi:hypothetical protein